MLINNKGQMAGYEALIIICLLSYSVFITYKWATKQTETKVFQKGSNARIFEPQPHFGCSNVKIEEYYEGKLHGILNSQNNSR